jgi:hypothetical protein
VWEWVRKHSQAPATIRVRIDPKNLLNPGTET